MHQEIAILVNLSICLSVALVLGYVTQQWKLSPIVGYLLAGIVVGPQTPGVVADADTAAQFAEIGVVLLMFGVGMHFDLRDLLAVWRVAVPGALGQVAVATLLGAVALYVAGWGIGTGIVMGIAISVASTVVLIRVLGDNHLLESHEGHVAVGWLVVEDLFTVFALVTLPTIAAIATAENAAPADLLWSFGIALLKVVALGVIVLWGGRRIIPEILHRVARTRSRELFTLAILALALTIATGSSLIFGVSMALGAFLAGMVVGQSEVSHQAAADAIPMRDAFAVLFFVSVGMLFDPHAVAEHPWLTLVLLATIMLAKPLAAIVIVWTLGHSWQTALTVAVGLAQIGEFSFIVADVAGRHGLLPPAGRSLLVACAIVSIALNPLLFRGIGPLQAWLRRRPRLWKFLTERSVARAQRTAPAVVNSGEASTQSQAIIVGYGPVGKAAATILREFSLEPIIIDLNVDTIAGLKAAGERAVYGDAARREILEAAGVASAKYLLITIPDLQTRTVIVLVARELNPALKVLVRARYIAERAWLEEIGATEVCYEEAETAVGLATLLLHEVGADESRIRDEQHRIRQQFALQTTRENGDITDTHSSGQPEN